MRYACLGPRHSLSLILMLSILHSSSKNYFNVFSQRSVGMRFECYLASTRQLRMRSASDFYPQLFITNFSNPGINVSFLDVISRTRTSFCPNCWNGYTTIQTGMKSTIFFMTWHLKNYVLSVFFYLERLLLKLNLSTF